MRTKSLRLVLAFVLALVVSQWTYSERSGPSQGPVPLKPMRGFICERQEFPPGRPISGCFFTRIPQGAICNGECVIHDTNTLYFGVCIEAAGICKPYQIQIRVGSGKVAKCISRIRGVHTCGCPHPNSALWRPVSGIVVTINTC